MKIYEIVLLCDTEGCDSYETSESALFLHDAEQQIEEYCIGKDWEIQGNDALCPDCIAAVANEQHEPQEDPIEYMKRTQT